MYASVYHNGIFFLFQLMLILTIQLYLDILWFLLYFW